ncbi:MAG: peptidoglycan DD-metalloendopeptidase family protein [Crocinitomicaceae bacterium]|nr:peptidoglycan DD-metalloendopeptidase family protein [Crocinitomicaceae bacterium]
MPTVQLVDDPSVKASCRPLKVLQPEVSKAYFARREEVAEYETEVIDHKTTSGQTLSKIATQHGVNKSECKRTKTTKYLQIGEIVKVTKKKKTGIKVTFKKADKASMNEVLFVIAETKNLQGEKMKVNILQGVEDVVAKKGKSVTIQHDDKDTTLIEANVGEYCEEEEITNKDDFKDWAIAKVKMGPKDDDKSKEWKDGLDCAGSKKALLFLLVDFHSDHSNSAFEAKYMLYNGFKGAEDDSNIRNHFLNETGAYLEVEKGGLLFPFQSIPLNHPDGYKNDSYKSYDYTKTEKNAACFAYKRGSNRIHAACDLYYEVNEKIYAMDDGEVKSVKAFYYDTWAIEIEHEYEHVDGKKLYLRYGEVSKDDIKVKVGDKVKKGDHIAKVGLLVPHVKQPGSDKRGMLHLEMYTGEATGSLSSKSTKYSDMLTATSTNYATGRSFQRRKDLIDPLPLLKEAYDNSKSMELV